MINFAVSKERIFLSCIKKLSIMKFVLTELEYDLLVEISLLDGLHVTVVKSGLVTYLQLTGTQVREIVKRLFDNLWSDILSPDEKRIFSFLGCRFTDKCL